MSEPKILQLGKEMKYDIQTGKEITTNEYINGKQIYLKRVDLGNLPNNSSKKVNPELSNNSQIQYFRCYAKHDTQGSVADVPSTLGQVLYTGPNKMISINTTTDRSEWHAYIDLYYTKS